MKYFRAKLRFPKVTLLKSNLNLDNTFSGGAEYDVNDVEILNGKLSFGIGSRNIRTYFSNVDIVKNNIDIIEVNDNV